MGTTQLLSVPYALYAGSVQNENDPVFKNSVAASISQSDITHWNSRLLFEVDSSNIKELPTINIKNDTNIISIGLEGQAKGDMIYYNGTNWVILPKGKSGQILMMSHDSIPIWQKSSLVILDPVSITTTATDIQVNSAIFNGIVNPNGFITNVFFEYDTNPNFTSYQYTIPIKISGTSNINVNQEIELLANTTYYYRIKAENPVNIVSGENISFTTLANTPSAVTLPASNIHSYSATLNGKVNANGLNTIVTFEYGKTTSYGNEIIAPQCPITGNVDSLVFVEISGLGVGKFYHYRLKAVNSMGISYSEDMTFMAQYHIGENCLGEMIIYVDNSGLHGLVCALNDQSTDSPWGCEDLDIPNVSETDTAVGKGKQNTINIVNNCDTRGIAARICFNLILNGYDDWFLPSTGELCRMIYCLIKYNPIYDGRAYWSSTERTRQAAITVFYLPEYNTEPYPIIEEITINKESLRWVRAIRYF
ncbi:MAG: hypothetical protein AUJ97_00850 [Bacteroidetes bacterium CG2_30_32_10]|nr:MAG: hypothetical protein AUJ97_00850 [Bacteroidetes bacterium CG2_30_32_10]